MENLLPEMKTLPAVFAVKNSYQIAVPVKSEVLLWVTVDGQDYFNHSNGIVRSDVRLHKVEIPMEILDSAKKYTVSYRKVVERKPYFTVTEETVSAEYEFFPVQAGKPIHIYHLADTHGTFDLPVACASYFGDDIDLLVLNGDIPDHSGDVDNFDLIYRLCSAITGGKRPCVFSRGNHDTRGKYAENIADYTPCENGKSYYSFRLGPIWGIVLDCGEDKEDSHPEYGHTVCCHQFRREETAYLEKIIKNAKEEYEAEGVKYKLVICHVPFTQNTHAPFNIEQELYKKWVDLLKDNVKPDLMLAGHTHKKCISHIGGKLDGKGQPCTVAVASDVAFGENPHYEGGAITLFENSIKIEYTDKDRNVSESENIKI